MKKSLIHERIFAEISEVVPTIGYFMDQETLNDYNKFVDKDYKGLSALKPFRFDEEKGEVVGSNIPGKILLFNEFLKPAGYEMSGLQKLEDARVMHKRNPAIGLDTSGYCYVDTGIVVKKDTERTADIVEQIRKRDPKLAKLKVPVAINLDGLEVRVGGKLDGVSYVLTDRTQLYEAPEYAGNNKLFNRVENGRPIVQEQGSRTVWNNAGLDISGLCLFYGNLDIDSSNDDLADSDEAGRVVLVRGEADNAKILQEYIAKQNANLQELRGKLKTRYQSGLKEIESLAQRLGVK